MTRAGDRDTNIITQNDFVPADGTKAANWSSGDFGTSSLFWQRSAKQLLEPCATVHWFWPR